MRVLVAPDDFKGTLSAVAAAEAIAAGWRARCPADEITLRPLSDGGPGFVAVIQAARPDAEFFPVTVRGPGGEQTPAGLLLDDGAPDDSVLNDGELNRGARTTVYLESAQACGLHLLAEPDPLGASTYGVGELIEAALRAGAQRIVLGLGGSATTDGGAGMLAALGARARDAGGQTTALDAGGAALARVASIDLTGARERVAGVELVIASDVDVPLLGARGAARGFSPQKGATAPEVEMLESALASFAAVVGRSPDGKDAAVALGAGAAGGLGYGLLALGARRVPGIRTVQELVGLDAGIAAADLVITGEGCFDWQSLRGKVVAGVAEAALAQARPVVVLAGRVEVGRREFAGIGVTSAYGVVEPGQPPPVDPAGALSDAAARVAGQWSRG